MWKNIRSYKKNLALMIVILATVNFLLHRFNLMPTNNLDEIVFDGFHSGLFLKLVILSSVFLLFFKESVYRAWRWFAFIGIPLGVALIIFSNDSGGVVGGREVLSDLLGIIFLSTTLLIAAVVTVVEKWFRAVR